MGNTSLAPFFAFFLSSPFFVYNVKPQLRAEVLTDQLAQYKALYAKHGAGRTNLAYGYAHKAA